eukprot:g77070.t1
MSLESSPSTPGPSGKRKPEASPDVSEPAMKGKKGLGRNVSDADKQADEKNEYIKASSRIMSCSEMRQTYFFCSRKNLFMVCFTSLALPSLRHVIANATRGKKLQPALPKITGQSPSSIWQRSNAPLAKKLNSHRPALR